MASRKTILLAAAALAGCGDIIGLDGYSEGDGSVIPDVTVTDTGGGDARPDVKSDVAVTDAGNDVVQPTCTTGNVCVPALPSGWTWLVYSQDSRSPCGLGYGTPTDVEEGIDAAAPTCSCGCTVTGGGCTTGNLTITSGTNGTCSNNSTQTDTAAGGCQTLGTSINTGGGVKIAVTGPVSDGGTCTAAADASVPPVGYDHQGRTCVPAASPDAGCGGGNVCLPDPTPFSACITQTGNNACPTGFPNQHLIGSTVDDTRGCSGCGCTVNSGDAGACGGSVTFYHDFTPGTCASGTGVVPVDSTCTTLNAHTWNDYEYVPEGGATCTPTGTASADGGVVFGNLATVCCP